MELFLLYCWLKLDGTIIFLACLAFLLAVLFIGNLGWCTEGTSHDEDRKRKERTKVFRNLCFIGSIISGLTAMLLPSQLQTAVLAGTWVRQLVS